MNSRAWIDLLKSAAEKLMPVLVTAVGSVGFVAFAGSVIVWTRFQAAHVPPDQAVAAFPRDELVAIGSALLLLFGFFGILATLAVYLVDRGGRATPGMSRALLVLIVVEGTIGILLVDDSSRLRTAIALELFLLPMGLAIWATHVRPWVRLRDTLPRRRTESELGAEEPGNLIEAPPLSSWLRDEEKSKMERRKERARNWLVLLAAVAVCGLATAVTRFWSELMLATAIVLLILGALPLLAMIADWVHQDGRNEETEAREKKDAGEAARQGSEWPWLSCRERLEDEAPRRPMRIDLSHAGMVVISFAMACAVIFPSLVMERWWLAASLSAAMAIGVGLWRIAALSNASFLWYGLAVFISVPLFGTLTGMARNIEDPQVQPMALIRSTDGPDEAIQGIYVTESEERVYFATLSSQSCSSEIVSHSGRLLWVPKSEVVAMSVGPLQDVADAARTSLEMSYALTPAVESPGAGPTVSPGAVPAAKVAGESADDGGVDGDAGEGDEAPPEEPHRLESVGAAVRPYFGSGLSLDPPHASPGDEVTLRMSSPSHGGGSADGFGVRREGKSVRVGGVPADVVKKAALSAEGAEFLRVAGGQLLTVDKEGAYVLGEDGSFEPAGDEEPSWRRRYVKLDDPAVAEVNGTPFDPGEGAFLPLRLGVYPAALLPAEVTLREGGTAELERGMLRQAWGEDEIEFRVPEGAGSGAVTVECEQLAGQPLLRVTRSPVARINVRIRAGTRRVLLDSGASDDPNGRIVSRRWTVEGVGRGGRTELRVDLPPRDLPYPVRLTVTDAEGQTDAVELELLRLPATFFDPGRTDADREAVERARGALRRALGDGLPAAIEIDGYADRRGAAAANLRLSMLRAESIRAGLLDPGLLAGPPSGRGWVPVTTIGYGEACPADRDGGGTSLLDRRVDVFVLDQGASVTPARGCLPGRIVSSRWRPGDEPAR